MYTITGVTGKTGAAAAESLLAAKKNIRVIVRDKAKGEVWAKRGAEVVVASYSDHEALVKAFSGVEGIYVMIPPFGLGDTGIKANRAALLKQVMGALTVAKPKHVVALSSIGAQHESGTGPIEDLYPMEKELAASGIATTFVRAAYFMENLGGNIPGALATGKLYNGLEAAKKFPMVATKDIGETVASLLVEPIAQGTRIVELSGPEEYSMVDAAKAISKASGKDVEVVQIPISAMVQALEGMGMSSEVAQAYGTMTGAINTGKVAWEGAGALARRGKVQLQEVINGMIRG